MRLTELFRRSGARAAFGPPWLSMLASIVGHPVAARCLLGVGLLATILASLAAWKHIRTRDETVFYARTEELRNALVQELETYAGLLEGARAMWAIHPPATPEEWKKYVESLDLPSSYPGLRALGYIERVSASNLTPFLEEIRRDPSRQTVEVRPKLPASEHYLVKYVEPFETNRAALCYDIRTEANRRKAAELAGETDSVTLSPKIELVQAPDTPGVLLLLPVYATNPRPTTVALRKASLVGWVYAAITVGDLVPKRRVPAKEELKLEIYDGSALVASNRLYTSNGERKSFSRAERAGIDRQVWLTYGNRAWALHFRPGADFPWTPWFAAPGHISAAALGFCITLLVSVTASALNNTRQRAEGLAHEMTAKLRLQHDVIASARNGLFILDAGRPDCPIIYANPAFEKMTGYAPAGQLGDETMFLLRTQTGAGVLEMNTMVQDGAGEHKVVREYRREGEEFFAEFQLLPVVGEGGRTTHYLGIAEDVTQRLRAERQLAQAEQRYYDLVNNLQVGVYRNTTGETGRFLEVNNALIHMFEAGSREELLAHGVSELYADPEKRREFSNRLLHLGFAKDVELELVTLKGRKFWASITASVKRDGAETFFDGVISDITERKQAEEAVRNSEARLRAILESAAEAIITAGPTGRVESWNPAAAEMFGYTADELAGRHVDSLVSLAGRERSNDDDATGHSFAAVCEPGAAANREAVGHRKDGSTIPIELSVSEVRLSGGKVFTGIARDITKRKEAERALRESQERFALAVRGTNDGIWDWNVVTGEVYFSPRWKSMLGYEDNEVENTFGGWQRLLHPEDRAMASAAIKDYFSGQMETYALEHRLRRKDGGYSWILARGVALRDTAGKPLRMAGSHVDLTARKQAEEKLREAYRELAQSQEALKETLEKLKTSHEALKQMQLQLVQAAKMECIGTLAAGVAHEVKNPLQTILLGLNYLDCCLPENQQDVRLALGDMRDAVTRADTIVRDLLQFSTQTAFELKPGDLNTSVERGLRLLKSELLAFQIKPECRLQTPLPQVLMDKRKLEQVFLNLFINAIQAMGGTGTLTISTRSGLMGQELQLNGAVAERFPAGSRLVVAEIQDSGPGIPREHLARIFDPFFTTKPVGKGTGLGLSIVRRIMELHNGAMEIRNAPQGGVLVTLAFCAAERGYEEKEDHDRG